MDLSGLLVANRYTVLRELGRGGMATVWLADDPQHARRVALKTLHPELGSAVGTQRFLREIRVTAQLQHPAIVPILDSGLLTLPDGSVIPWYAMPYLDGESVRARLKRESQLSIDDALRITEAAGRALEAAHRRDVVHRDIKPENVILSGGQVYVLDFGVARALAATDDDRLTSTGLALGTPAYMSPEQAMGTSVDARSDQYSLAVLLYEMLAGEPPFAGPNAQATLARRLAEPARPLSTVRSTVPPTVERAILRALERTPADRFPSVTAFLDALRAPAEALPAARPPRTARPLRLAVVGVVVALGLAAWALRPRSVDPELVARYERGVRAFERRTPAGVVEAVQSFSEVIRRDSTYAPAWNALAKAYSRAWLRGFSVPDVPRERLLQLAVNAVNRAIAEDPENADTWLTHAVVTQQVEPTSLEPPLRSIRRAIALDSNQAPAWHQFAILTAESGDLGSALDGWRRSIRIDPGYSLALAFLALGHYWRGDYDSAAAWIDSAVAVDPNYLLARQSYAQIETERGNHEAAVSQAQAAVNLSEDAEWINSTAILATARARGGQRNLAMTDLLLAEVAAAKVVPTAHTAVWIAAVHAVLGNVKQAVATLGSYRTPRDQHFQFHLRCDPTFASLAEDPAFRSLLVTPRPAPGLHC